MTTTPHKYLVFTLMDYYYAFDLAQIAEVVEKPVVCPIPLAPTRYLGAINFHGTIVAVLDLALFLGRPKGHDSGRIVVLDKRIGALAFSVENIIRITSQEHSVMTGNLGDEAFAVGTLSLPEGRTVLLDAAAIAEHAANTING